MIPINEPYSDGEYGTRPPCRVPVGWVLGGSCLMSPSQAGFKSFFMWLSVKSQPSVLGIEGEQWDAQLPGSTHS